MGRPVGRNATAHHRLPGEQWAWPGTPPNLTDHRLRSFAVRLKNQTLAADPAGLQSALGWRGPRRGGFRLSAFRRQAGAEHPADRATGRQPVWTHEFREIQKRCAPLTDLRIGAKRRLRSPTGQPFSQGGKPANGASNGTTAPGRDGHSWLSSTNYPAQASAQAPPSSSRCLTL